MFIELLSDESAHLIDEMPLIELIHVRSNELRRKTVLNCLEPENGLG
jgi:hypothetical protein